MDWKDYSKEKPKKKYGQCLIAVSWHPDIMIYKVSTWNGKYFKDWNHYDDCESKVNDVKYWCEIEEPKKEV